MAKANPFRFSTKYQDDENDLLYYGYRYYKPSTGTWLCRDRIQEHGGFNIFGFLGNNPINRADKLGNATFTPRWVGAGASGTAVGDLWAGLSLWPTDDGSKGYVVADIDVTFKHIFPCSCDTAPTIGHVNYSFLATYTENQFDASYNPTHNDFGIWKFVGNKNAIYYSLINTFENPDPRRKLSGTYGIVAVAFSYDAQEGSFDDAASFTLPSEPPLPTEAGALYNETEHQPWMLGSYSGTDSSNNKYNITISFNFCANSPFVARTSSPKIAEGPDRLKHEQGY